MQKLFLKQNTMQLYSDLKVAMEEKGLLKTRKWKYCVVTAAILVLLTSSYLLSTMFGAWGLIPGALLFAFFAVQFGFIGHDAAHRAITKSKIMVQLIGQFSMSFVHGVSFHYWWWRHSEHHANPNDEEMDPDVNGMPYPYSERAARKAKHIWKITSRYPEYFLSILPFGSVIFMRVTSWIHIIKQRNWKMLDFFPIALHFIVFLGLPIFIMGPWLGILFYTIASLLVGFYFGSVFIPNHLGMPTIKDEKMSFFDQQLLTSRDIDSPKKLDFFFGGLNYQVEHHLFPTMPRWNLRKAKKIVKSFCEEHNLNYHEENTLQTYKGLFTFSRKIGMSLRNMKLILAHSM